MRWLLLAILAYILLVVQVTLFVPGVLAVTVHGHWVRPDLVLLVGVFVALYFGTANPEGGTHRYLQVAGERFYLQVDQNNDDLESYSDDAAGGCNINAIGATGMKICGLRWETATGSNNGQRLYLNSLTVGSTDAVTADTTLTGTSVTVLNDRGNTQVFTELLVYDSALDDTDFATVMNGLATLYGVTLT